MMNKQNDQLIRQCIEGGTFFCLDVPKGTEFGIDQHIWKTGDRFKGIKMIPNGFHYIRWRNNEIVNDDVTISGKDANRVVQVSEGGTTSIIPLMNFFVFIEQSQIFTFRWDSSVEDLVRLETDESERYKEGIRRMEFDQYLGPFPSDSIQLKSWKLLTNHITNETIKNCTGNEKQSQFHFYYTNIPSRWIPENLKDCTGSDLTKYHMDKSYLLHHLIETKFSHNWNELFGEFQFSFISFWLAESYESFEQWKKLIIVFCNCESSLEEYPEKWIIILQILSYQLQEVPQDFFIDILSCKNFLEPSLRSLFELLAYFDAETSLGNAFLKLKSVVEKRFNKSFDENSDDEDQPTVVIW